MHLLISHASALSEACSGALRDLPLPNLGALLARLSPTERDEGDEAALLVPHERALARAWGWPSDADTLPLAALAAAGDGIDTGERAWGLLTPAHWLLGRDHVALADPQTLGLDEAESRALFDTVRDLFASEGFELVWGAPMRWYAAHESLASFPTASLDRAIGRSVEPWLQLDVARHPQARLLRRLQSEVQMTLYQHPVNEAREARGALPVNSFWLSGCGRFRPADTSTLQLESGLRAAWLAHDWAAWAGAFRVLDGGPLADLLARAVRGEPVRLTLCGERSAQTFEPGAGPLWKNWLRRWRAAPPQPWLEAL